jgi:hypothetical protein
MDGVLAIGPMLGVPLFPSFRCSALDPVNNIADRNCQALTTFASESPLSFPLAFSPRCVL